MNLLNDDLHNDSKSFKAAIRRTSKLKDSTLIDNLAFAREDRRQLKSDYEAKVREFNDKMAPYTAEKKALDSVFAEADETITEELLRRLKKNKRLPEETANGISLTISKLPRLTVKSDTTFEDVPEEFLLPVDQCIDWKAVNAAETMPDFVAVFEQISLRTKIPEVME